MDYKLRTTKGRRRLMHYCKMQIEGFHKGMIMNEEWMVTAILSALVVVLVIATLLLNKKGEPPSNDENQADDNFVPPKDFE